MGRPTPTPLKWASAARIYGLLPRNAPASADGQDVSERPVERPTRQAPEIRRSVTSPPEAIAHPPEISVARIQAVSEPDPFWNWICLPHYDAGSRCQNEARGFSRAVIVVGNIHRSERLGRIGDASGVAPPYVGIRNDMTSLCSPIPDASDTSFRAVYSKKDQVSLKPARSGFSDQTPASRGWKGLFRQQSSTPARDSRLSVSELPFPRRWRPHMDPTDSGGGRWHRGPAAVRGPRNLQIA
jgi:hypothetical protein